MLDHVEFQFGHRHVGDGSRGPGRCIERELLGSMFAGGHAQEIPESIGILGDGRMAGVGVTVRRPDPASDSKTGVRYPKEEQGSEEARRGSPSSHANSRRGAVPVGVVVRGVV